MGFDNVGLGSDVWESVDEKSRAMSIIRLRTHNIAIRRMS